jgi:predicted outer membrane lipoprotein
MAFSFDMATTLAHLPEGGVMIGVLLLASALGFIAGLFFERATNRKSRDRES